MQKTEKGCSDLLFQCWNGGKYDSLEEIRYEYRTPRYGACPSKNQVFEKKNLCHRICRSLMKISFILGVVNIVGSLSGYMVALKLGIASDWLGFSFLMVSGAGLTMIVFSILLFYYLDRANGLAN